MKRKRKTPKKPSEFKLRNVDFAGKAITTVPLPYLKAIIRNGGTYGELKQAILRTIERKEEHERSSVARAKG